MLLPVIAAARLVSAGHHRPGLLIMPREGLRLQANEAFADPAWRAALGHALAFRAAEIASDPRGGSWGSRHDQCMAATAQAGGSPAPQAVAGREFRRGKEAGGRRLGRPEQTFRQGRSVQSCSS